jgi:hypothetical protein
MSLLCIALRNSGCFFLFPLLFFFQHKANGQDLPFDTLLFYKHLKGENLLTEHIAFAHKLLHIRSNDQPGNDTLYLDIAAVYYKMNRPDSGIFNLKKISGIAGFSEKKKELYMSLLVLFKQYTLAAATMGNLASGSFRYDTRTSFSILTRERTGLDTGVRNSSPAIIDLQYRYANTPHPSPFLAGAFSAVLPGAGKWYVGYKRQALTALIANALFAAQAAESYSKAGAPSAQFIITAGLFGVFYAGNIWGSVLAAKKKKRDYLNEIDYEVLDHYRAGFSRLYR